MKETIQLLSLMIDIVQDNPHIEFTNEQVYTCTGIYMYMYAIT